MSCPTSTSRRAADVLYLIAFLVGSAIVVLTPAIARAQVTTAKPPGATAIQVTSEPSGEAATLALFNRPIAVFRARVLGRMPADRADAAERALDELVDQGIAGPVEARSVEGGSLINVGSRVVFGIGTADIDELSGETLENVTAQTIARLQAALGEAIEARTPGAVVRSILIVGAGLVLTCLAVWLVLRTRRLVERRLEAIANRTFARTSGSSAELVHTSRLITARRALATAIISVLFVVVIYWITSWVLRNVPYTRVWGESMRSFLLSTIARLGLGTLRAIPGLFTAALILLAIRFLTLFVGAWFNAVERGGIQVAWMYPETAVPTRRLVTVMLWLFGIIVAYPYLPGSDTEAFKGVSVFVGLILTLGSSGVMNQLMSGFMITYSRALRRGDFVQIGDVIGTVTHLGLLSTKVRTPRNEEVTIPNAVVVGQTTTDYTRLAETEGVLTSTEVTIGYDAPWRQVHAMLLEAARRTPGLRATPEPFVLQTALEDSYVRYRLNVSLERQETRFRTLNILHGHIQDLFNEHGVQIMSPNYEGDPERPKIVARKDWFTPPAGPEGK